MSLPSLTYYNYSLISAPKIHSDLLWDLSVLFIGLAVLYFVSIFFYRNKISSNTKKVRDHKRELSPMISEFLFLEEDASKDEKSNYLALKIEIRQLLKSDFNRKILSEILLDLRKDLSGETQKSLLKLYQDLDLEKDAFAKLNDWRWQVVSKGILELTQMEVTDAYSFITKFINDKRSTIRKQAEIATVTLKHEGINYFLDTTKHKISEWQQLKLLDVIRNKKDFQPPLFKAWLTSNNKHVVLFALRLIKYYNQSDACDSVIELVKHKNNQIKEEAVACIKEFHVTKARHILKLVFWNSTINVKIAILDAIGEIGSEADIEFLKTIDKKELNFAVKSKALSSINTISPESIMPSKGILEESRYVIPEDITEAVAKIHAKKHEDLSVEFDPDVNDDQVAEKLVVADKTAPEVLENEEDVSEAVYTVNEEQIQDLPLEEEIGIQPEIEEVQRLCDIEVIIEAEEIVAEKDIENEPENSVWNESHLDFLPVIVNEEEKKLEEDNQYIEKASFFDAFNIKELAFLPLVVENESIAIQIEEPATEKVDLLDIIVLYDVVSHNLPVTEKDTSTIELDSDLETSHDISVKERPVNDIDMDYKRYETEKIFETIVIYEEVLKRNSDFEIFELEVIEPYIFEQESKSEENIEIMNYPDKEEHDEVELPIEDAQILQKIIDDLLSDDNAQQEKANELKIDASYVNPDWDLDESDFDFTPVSFERKEQPTNFIRISKSLAQNKQEELEDSNPNLPKAIFGDIEFEASTRNLLNELEVMGDTREIPFLKELLAKEKYASLKERIINLIETFNENGSSRKIENQQPPFSVFSDLFRTCDTEAKLILLDEVVVVGDQKEIYFLENLYDDDSLEVRDKALVVLNDLKAKLYGDNLEHSKTPEMTESESFDLSNEKEAYNSIAHKDPADIFNLNFDLTMGVDGTEKEKNLYQNTRHYGSFLGQICTFSNKIIERLNG